MPWFLSEERPLSNPTTNGKLVSLPTWAIAVLLILGLVSIPAAPGMVFTGIAALLLAANGYFTWTAFSAEVERLRAAGYKAKYDAAQTDSERQAVKAEIKAEAMKTQRVPLWQLGLLAAGSVWAFIWLAQVIGTIVVILLVIGLIAGLGVAAYFGYRHAEKKGYIK